MTSVSIVISCSKCYYLAARPLEAWRPRPLPWRRYRSYYHSTTAPAGLLVEALPHLFHMARQLYAYRHTIHRLVSGGYKVLRLYSNDSAAYAAAK